MNRAEKRAMERAARNPLRGVPRHRVARLHSELQAARHERRMRPITAGSALNNLTMGHGAINRLTGGSGCADDLIDLLVISYTAHELACAGYAGPDTTADITAAGAAIEAIKRRADRMGRYGVTGEELHALRELLALYDAQLNHDPRPSYAELLAAQDRVMQHIEHHIQGAQA